MISRSATVTYWPGRTSNIQPRSQDARSRSHGRICPISSIRHDQRLLHTALPHRPIFLRFSATENAPLIKSILGNRRYMTDRLSASTEGTASKRDARNRENLGNMARWGASHPSTFLPPFLPSISLLTTSRGSLVRWLLLEHSEHSRGGSRDESPRY